MTTERERQVREYLAAQARDWNRVAIDSARQRRREAKCALMGHEPTEDVDVSEEPCDEPLYVCRRCGHDITDEVA